jgi:two-component system alkaline phosphatase synthesis response regulator PhoP
MSGSAPKVLLVEDERNIALGISYNFEKHGYDVEVADRGDVGLKLATEKNFDLIILDVMLPGMNGFQICEELRKRDIRAPVLMLTARSETENKIKGIRLGADDYLAKPFDRDELFARAESLLRRRQWDREPRFDKPFDLGGISFDASQLKLKCNKRSVELTPIETKLLLELIQAQGRPVPRADLLNRVWGFHKDTQTRTLDNFVMRLRQHFDELNGNAELIESVRGVGYRLKQTKK